MKRSDDPTGLQLLFTGAVAIALALHVVGVFVYRLYSQRFTQHETIAQEEQE